MTKHVVGGLCVALVALALAPGCSDEGDDLMAEVDEAVDCAELCQRYDECVDPATDLTACAEQCEDDSDNQPGFSGAAEQCDDCLDGKSCEQAETAGCWANCPALAITD